MVKNTKFILLIFILAVFSFINSELNSFVKHNEQLAQSGPGIIDLWSRLYRKKTNKEKLPTYRYSLWGMNFDYPEIYRIITGKNKNYSVIKHREFQIFTSPKGSGVAEDLIIRDLDLAWEKCLNDLECRNSIRKNTLKTIIFTDTTKEYESLVKKGGSVACALKGRDIIVLNLEAFLVKVKITDKSGHSREETLFDYSGIVDDTLPHELTHVIIDQICGRSVAAGFNEGMAEMAEFNEDSIVPKIYDSRTILTKTTPPDFSPFKRKSPPYAFYQDSRSLIKFLSHKTGSRANVLRFYQDLSKSNYSTDVLKKYGFKDFSDLDKQWYSFVDKADE